MEKEDVDMPRPTSTPSIEDLEVSHYGNGSSPMRYSLLDSHASFLQQPETISISDSKDDVRSLRSDSDDGVGLESEAEGENSFFKEGSDELQSLLGEETNTQSDAIIGEVENSNVKQVESIGTHVTKSKSEIEIEIEKKKTEIETAKLKEQQQNGTGSGVDVNINVNEEKGSKRKPSLPSRPIKKLKLDILSTNVNAKQRSPPPDEKRSKNTLSFSDHQKLLAESARKKMEMVEKSKSKAANVDNSASASLNTPASTIGSQQNTGAKAIPAKTNVAVLAAALQARKNREKKADRKTSLKRARPRKRVIKSSDEHQILDLSPPVSTDTSWNASEVIKDFLFIGAGWDQSGRCLVNRIGDPEDVVTERFEFCRRHNLRFNLNMAGSPFQKELEGIKYPLPEAVHLQVDINDVDCWVNEMEEAFDQGARFLQMAWNEHVKQKESAKEQQAKYPDNQIVIILPTVFVHCVAGVNRSPFVVVWWMIRYHGIHLSDAWEIVRQRRDSGAHWTNVTLGGAAPPPNFVPDIKIMYSNKAVRSFQHTITILPRNNKPDGEEDIKLNELGINISNNKGAVVSATSVNPHPKFFWYLNCDRVLKQYYKRRYKGP